MAEHGDDGNGPGAIMAVGTGFSTSKTLLSVVELGLFTTLGSTGLTGGEIAERLDLRSRAVFDCTGADFTGWCREVGFDRVEIVPVTGPASAAIAYR